MTSGKVQAKFGLTLGKLWANFGQTFWADFGANFGLTLGKLWADFGQTSVRADFGQSSG